MELQSLGVVTGVDSVGLKQAYTSIKGSQFFHPLRSHDKIFVVQHPDPTKTMTLGMIAVTEMGLQVIELGRFEADIEYFKFVGKGIAPQGFSVQLGDWTMSSATEIMASNLDQISA